jgi:GxxExxY protein
MMYKGVEIPKSFRADVVVGESLLLEIKAVNAIVRVHEMQALTCLRLSGWHVGLLFNFNTALLKDGLRRYVL